MVSSLASQRSIPTASSPFDTNGKYSLVANLLVPATTSRKGFAPALVRGQAPSSATASACTAGLSSGAVPSLACASAKDAAGRIELSWLLLASTVAFTPAVGPAIMIGRTRGKIVSASRSVIGCGG